VKGMKRVLILNGTIANTNERVNPDDIERPWPVRGTRHFTEFPTVNE